MTTSAADGSRTPPSTPPRPRRRAPLWLRATWNVVGWPLLGLTGFVGLTAFGATVVAEWLARVGRWNGVIDTDARIGGALLAWVVVGGLVGGGAIVVGIIRDEMARIRARE